MPKPLRAGPPGGILGTGEMGRMIEVEDIRVLIVEDQESMQELLRFGLTGVGFRYIVGRKSVESAITVLEKDEIDVIVCDYNLGTSTGIELLDYVRGHDKLDRMPFIMVTAHGDEAVVKAAIKGGVNGFALKPVSAEALKKKIMQAIVSRGGRARR
jgi:two-component system chemotaxis response regulator CheY